MEEVTIEYSGKPAKFIIKNGNEHIQKHWAAGMFYETQRNGLLNMIYLRHGRAKKIIDIGASIGNHTIFFSKVIGARVIAFEPYSHSYQHLTENIELNDIDNVEAYNVALGQKEEFLGMISAGEDQIGMMQITEDPSEAMNIEDVVTVKPLDAYKDIVEGYDVIKIDVEHYNEQLLKGAAEVLTLGTGTVYIEAETPKVLKVTDKYMNKYGYIREPGVKLNHTPTYIYNKK